MSEPCPIKKGNSNSITFENKLSQPSKHAPLALQHSPGDRCKASLAPAVPSLRNLTFPSRQPWHPVRQFSGGLMPALPSALPKWLPMPTIEIGPGSELRTYFPGDLPNFPGSIFKCIYSLSSRLTLHRASSFPPSLLPSLHFLSPPPHLSL